MSGRVVWRTGTARVRVAADQPRASARPIAQRVAACSSGASPRCISICGVTCSAGRVTSGRTTRKPPSLGGSPVTGVATNTALKPIKVGGLPEPIVITPDGKTIYVVNLNSRTVTPIRVATNTALPPIKAGPIPIGIAITS
jgi:YVTN family beta-propeller protein